MNALFKYLIIALAFCCDFAFGISYPVSYGTATKDTVYAHGTYIVVERGCRLNIVKQDSSGTHTGGLCGTQQGPGRLWF